jgi:hypothetical protein
MKITSFKSFIENQIPQNKTNKLFGGEVTNKTAGGKKSVGKAQCSSGYLCYESDVIVSATQTDYFGTKDYDVCYCC